MPFDNRWEIGPDDARGPFVLGQTREQCLQRLQTLGLKCEVDPGEPRRVTVSEPTAALVFSGDSPSILLQISCDDESLQLNDRKVVGEPLDQALVTLGVQRFEDALWRYDDEPEEELLDDQADGPAADPQENDGPDLSITAEDLLCNGTLWIRSLGVGLMIFQGEVLEIYFRRPADAPQNGHGPLLEEHLQLALSEEYRQKVGAVPSTASRPASLLRRVATPAFIICVLALILTGVQEQQRWRQTPRAPGVVIAIEQPTKNTGRPIYVVEYHDDKGGRHEARWTLGDLDVSPAIGDKLDVAYLPEAPDQPLGPARIQDVAFQKYCPLVIAAAMAYFMTLLLDQFLTNFFRRPPSKSPPAGAN